MLAHSLLMHIYYNFLFSFLFLKLQTKVVKVHTGEVNSLWYPLVQEECQCDFWQFDSVHHKTLLEHPRLCGNPAIITGLLSGLYSGMEIAVVWQRYDHPLSCEYQSEGRLCLCLITFQQLYGLDTGLSYGPRSLWSIHQQKQGY